MPTSTTNYGLIKPGTDDPILIGQINDNMDAIDTVLKDHSDKIDAAALGIKFKGEVNYYSNLPNSAEIGDAYTVKYAGSSGTTPDGTEYVWGTVSGTNQWINFSKDSYSKAEVDALLALKQNALNSAQLSAVNSGINSEKVAQIETNKNNISKDEAALVELVDGGAKNIFDPTVIPQTTTRNGVTITRTEKGIHISGTVTATADTAIVDNIDLVIPSDGYHIYINTSASNLVLWMEYKVNGSSIYSPITRDALNAGYVLKYIYFKNLPGGSFFDADVDIMLCTDENYAISSNYVPYRPSYQELYEMVKALQPAT